MPWPVNALFETITAGVTTAKKSLADAIQSAINNLFNGDLTITKIHIDGAGGNPGLATPGTIRLDAKASGNVAPTTVVPLNSTFGDGLLIGRGRVVVVGAGIANFRGYNIKSVVRTGVGTYTVTFNTAPTQATVATLLAVSEATDVVASVSPGTEAITLNLVLFVVTRTVAGAPAPVDATFHFAAWSD
jgi:hypothetical protein